MHPIGSTLHALRIALFLVVTLAHSVADFFGETQSLPASARRRRRRALDGGRRELRALRRRMKLAGSRVHGGRVRLHRALGSADHVHALPEPPSPASVQRWLRRRWRRRFSAPEGTTLEIQLNRYSGDWEVLHLREDRPLSLHTNKKRAMSAARYRLRTEAGGEILVLDHNGKVIKRVAVAKRVKVDAQSFRKFMEGGNLISFSGRLASNPSLKVEGQVSGFQVRLDGDRPPQRNYISTVTLKS